MDGANLPTAFSSMMLWALTLAADMVAGLTEVVVKNLRRNEMLGKYVGGLSRWRLLMKGSRGVLYRTPLGMKGDINNRDEVIDVESIGWMSTSGSAMDDKAPRYGIIIHLWFRGSRIGTQLAGFPILSIQSLDPRTFAILRIL